MTINPMLLRLLIRFPGTTMIFRTFTTHILKVRTIIVNQIYPPEPQLKKSNTTILDTHLAVANQISPDLQLKNLTPHIPKPHFVAYGFVSSKMYHKSDDFDNDKGFFPF